MKMKTVFYGGQNEFQLTDQEFTAFIKTLEKNKRVWIPRLQVFLSDMFIYAGDKPQDKTKGYLHDGLYVEKQFGRWVDPTNPNAVLDPKYYPEIAKDDVVPMLYKGHPVEIKKAK